jgi:hypothetical protein
MSVAFTPTGLERTGPSIDDDVMVGLFESEEERKASFPHCDSRVLHHPLDNCEFCNLYPERQLERFENKVAFTGRWREGLERCPAEQERPLDIINRSHGNVAYTPEVQAQEEAHWAELRSAIGS